MKKTVNQDLIITNPPRKIELIDDIVYMSPAPSLKHNRIMGRINTAFDIYLRGKKCSVYMVSNVYYNPDKPKNHIIPDVAIMCEPDKFKPNGYYGVPSLIVEILSNNRKDDIGTKFELYERIGVKEYWIIDPISDSINQYILVDGKYKLLEAVIYLLDTDIEELEEQEEYKAVITPSIFPDLDIALSEIFGD